VQMQPLTEFSESVCIFICLEHTLLHYLKIVIDRVSSVEIVWLNGRKIVGHDS